MRRADPFGSRKGHNGRELLASVRVLPGASDLVGSRKFGSALHLCGKVRECHGLEVVVQRQHDVSTGNKRQRCGVATGCRCPTEVRSRSIIERHDRVDIQQVEDVGAYGEPLAFVPKFLSRSKVEQMQIIIMFGSQGLDWQHDRRNGRAACEEYRSLPGRAAPASCVARRAAAFRESRRRVRRRPRGCAVRSNRGG